MPQGKRLFGIKGCVVTNFFKKPAVVVTSILLVLFALIFCAMLLFQGSPENIKDLGIPEKIAPLSKVVGYYESKLDPAIPKITITARSAGEGFASDVQIPYTAKLVEGDWDDFRGGKYNKIWFVDLMNNFWSLPRLQDEESGRIPAKLTIQFDNSYNGILTVIDYRVYSEHGYVNTHWVEGSQELTQKTFTEHQRSIEVKNGTASFGLWDIIPSSDSNPPPLIGLRMKCSYEKQKVEYYILFRNFSSVGDFLSGADFSHLTPLKP